MERLDEKLLAYSNEDYYAFHMPGHKRKMSGMKPCDPFSIDITEIDGFDNLHHPTGIIKEAEERAARYYHAKETFYSVNGSTAALLSAVSASVQRNGTILIARNCHKAVYHGVYLRGLDVCYVYPQVECEYGLNGGILPEDVEIALRENPKIEAVLITSPSYDGVVSDVEKIAEVVHKFDKILIVDEAHGAHFGKEKYFPESSILLGADVVIQSLHKTLPAFTQTALIHCCTDRALVQQIKRFMGIYQSSSPSYLLMASMDGCIGKLEKEGEQLFKKYAAMLRECREDLKDTKKIRLVPLSLRGNYGIYDVDPSKLVLSVRYASINGHELAALLLEKYHLQMEMESEDYAIALTSIGDTKEGFDRLVKAVLELEDKLEESKKEQKVSDVRKNEICLPIWKAMESNTKICLLKDSVDKVSAEYLYLYPPGIPLLVPGERISEGLIQDINRYKKMELELQGTQDYQVENILIIEEE